MFRSIRSFLAMLIIALLAMGYGATPTSAQDPLPPTPAPESGSQPANGTIIDPSAYTLDETQPTPTVSADTLEATPEALSEADLSQFGIDTLQPRATQGSIQLDLSTPLDVRAGDYITYTYTYTNTSNVTENGIIVQAWWTDFGTSNTSNQYCLSSDQPASCGVLASTGPAVNKITCPSAIALTNRHCYQIPSIPPTVKGSFSVRLHVKSTIYPKTNQKITVLSGSAKLVREAALTTLVSDDTASSTVVGPVMVITKTAVTQGQIYTGENGTFKITLGNATGTKDKSGTIIRADARTATNIELVDPLPAGSAFVSATGGGVYDDTKKEVRWKFSQALQPGQTLPEVQVTFKKVGGDPASCDKLTNKVVKTTSKEFPLVNGTPVYEDITNGPSISVALPLKIRSLTMVPEPGYFGDQTTIEIVVDSTWNQALNNINLSFQPQSNITYMVGSAQPAANAGATPGQVTWTFSMPAGSKTAPTSKTFYVKAQMGYTKTATTKSVATLTMPPGIASDCPSISDALNVQPRLELTKTTNADPATMSGKSYVVTYDQAFEYIVKLKNNGSTDAENVTLLDTLPNGGQFELVPGSITGTNITPSYTPYVSIQWDGLNIPAGDTLEIHYKLRTKGEDFIDYCNLAIATFPEGPDQQVATGDSSKVCVRINPNIVLTKTANKSEVTLNPGGNTPDAQREIEYTLTIENKESDPYVVNFYDIMMDGLQYVGVVPNSAVGSPGDPVVDTYSTQVHLVWPLKTLAPGGKMSIKILARVPDVCSSKDYRNSLLFHNDANNTIQPTPAVIAKVRVNCGSLEYGIRGDRAEVSLRDKTDYTLTLRNADTTKAVTNAQIEIKLPENFTFVSMSSGSGYISTQPTQEISGTFTTLRWSVPSIAKSTTNYIKFTARSGDTILAGNVAEQGVLARVVAGGKCSSSCVSDPDGGALYASYKTKVTPLITLVPKILQTGCAFTDDLRTYRVSVINRNSAHAYNSTVITVTLPIGLIYSKPVGTTPAPLVISQGSSQILVWKNQTIPKPATNGFEQRDYDVELKVGTAIGALRATVQAGSPDGSIPQQEGTVDPTIFICLNDPAIALVVDKPLLQAGREAIFQILLANPETNSFTVSIEQTLPSQLVYVEFIEGVNGTAPTLTNGKLVWSGLTLPAATNGEYGQIVLRYRVRLIDTVIIGTTLQNTVRITSQLPATPAINSQRASAPMRVASDLFLPSINKP